MSSGIEAPERSRRGGVAAAKLEEVSKALPEIYKRFHAMDKALRRMLGEIGQIVGRD